MQTIRHILKHCSPHTFATFPSVVVDLTEIFILFKEATVIVEGIVT